MVDLDVLVLDMRDIMELTYILFTEEEEQLLSEIYDLLRERLSKFHNDCNQSDKNNLNDSLFYAISLIKAYQDDEILKKMATEIKDHISAVSEDLYLQDNNVIKK